MTYVPIPLSDIDFDAILFRNLYRIIEEYAVSNTYITVQDREKTSTYPLYTIYIPDTSKPFTDNGRNDQSRPVSVEIDFDALPAGGDWRKSAEMQNALEAGFKAEGPVAHGGTGNLNIAGIKYDGSETLSNQPIDINGQQVFCKTVRFDFTCVLRA